MTTTRSRRAGFSAMELAVCFVTIVLLSAILLSFGSNAHQRAKAMSCANNVGQLALAMQMYMADSGGRGPAGDVPRVILPYVKNTQIFKCPSDRGARSPLPLFKAGEPPKGGPSTGAQPPVDTSYQFETDAWSDCLPSMPIVQDRDRSIHVDDTFVLARLDGGVKRLPAQVWYRID